MNLLANNLIIIVSDWMLTCGLKIPVIVCKRCKRRFQFQTYNMQIALVATQQAFSPGSKDDFKFEHRNLQTLESCTLFHDGTGDFPDWTVQKVVS